MNIDTRPYETAIGEVLKDRGLHDRAELREAFDRAVDPMMVLRYFSEQNKREVTHADLDTAKRYLFNKVISWMSRGRNPKWIEVVEWEQHGSKRHGVKFQITDHGMNMLSDPTRRPKRHRKLPGEDARPTRRRMVKPDTVPEMAECAACGLELVRRDPKTLAHGTGYFRMRREGGINQVLEPKIDWYIHEHCLLAIFDTQQT